MKDRVISENIEIRYCPTEQMIADFFTKPLQGSLFKRFKRVIMGLDHISTLWISGPCPIEERVEKDGVLSLSDRPGRDNKARPESSFVNNPPKNVSSLVQGKARTKVQK